MIDDRVHCYRTVTVTALPPLRGLFKDRHIDVMFLES